MSEIKYATILLTDIFSVGRGLPKYTRSYADKHKGIYPVYSSKTDDDGVFATIDTYDYDGEYLTWSTDGYAGVPAYRNGKFSCTDHCGILVLNQGFENVYLPYVRYQIDFRKLRLGYGNQRVKVNQVKKANLYIKLPLDDKGNIDMQMQMQLAEKYDMVEERKGSLKEKAEKLKDIVVRIEQNCNIEYIPFEQIFLSVKRGKSKYTKLYCNDNSGEYPVYSADNDKPLGYMNHYDNDGEFLTISINGIAGKITIFNGKFSVNADRVVCIPREEVDIRYIRYVAEPIFRNSIKGRKGDLGKNEFSKLTPDMIKRLLIPIPIKEDGIFDLEIQKQLAAKYQQIEDIKSNLYEKVKKLLDVVMVRGE